MSDERNPDEPTPFEAPVGEAPAFESPVGEAPVGEAPVGEAPMTTITAAEAPATRRRGRPVVGAIAGLLLGLFVWLDLVVTGVLSLDSVVFWILPAAGLVVGLALGLTAPLRRSRSVAA